MVYGVLILRKIEMFSLTTLWLVFYFFFNLYLRSVIWLCEDLGCVFVFGVAQYVTHDLLLQLPYSVTLGNTLRIFLTVEM